MLWFIYGVAFSVFVPTVAISAIGVILTLIWMLSGRDVRWDTEDIKETFGFVIMAAVSGLIIVYIGRLQ